MSLEDTISQIQKNKYHMISHVKYKQLGLIEVGYRIVFSRVLKRGDGERENLAKGLVSAEQKE